MSYRHIDAQNIIDFTDTHGLSNLFSDRLPQGTLRKSHPLFGNFSVINNQYPGVYTLDFSWDVSENLLITDQSNQASIDLMFGLQGTMTGHFKRLGDEFEMTAGHHNLKFTPYEKNTHRVQCNEQVRMFHASIDCNYFLSLIGCDDPWSEEVNRKMQQHESFMASNQFLTMTPRMNALVQAMQTLQAEPLGRLKMHALFFELLACQVEQLRSLHSANHLVASLPTGDIQKLYLVKEYIDTHFLEDFSLHSLCQHAGLNEFKLKKGFKQVFNSSVFQYAKNIRMNYAQTLLQDHRKSVEEVSVMLGYQYPNHFSTAYRKHFGLSPSGRASA